MNKSIKLLGLFFGMLAVVPASKISAMNPEYAKQLEERRNRLMQADVQRQAAQEQQLVAEHDFRTNNNNNNDVAINNNDVIGDDVFMMQEQNDKKRELDLVGEQPDDNNVTKKQKLYDQLVVQNNSDIIDLVEQRQTVNFRENPDLNPSYVWMKNHPVVVDSNYNLTRLPFGEFITNFDLWGHTLLDVAKSMGDTLVKNHSRGRLFLDRGQNSPLVVAIRQENIEIVKILVHAGANPNFKILYPRHPATPLVAAVLEGNIEIVKILIHAGADVIMKNSDGFTALHYAASGGGKWDELSPLLVVKLKNMEIIKIVNILLNAGAAIEASDNTISANPLHCAFFQLEVIMMNIMLVYPISNKEMLGLINAKETMLEIIKILVKKVNADVINKKLLTATILHIAAKCGFVDLYDFLIDHGADATLLDENNRTAESYLHAGWINRFKNVRRDIFKENNNNNNNNQ